MSKNFAIIGGDLRTVKLVKLLSKDENKVYTYGLEKSEELKGLDNIIACDKLEDALVSGEIVIGPIPFLSKKETLNAPFSEKEIPVKNFMGSINNNYLIAGSVKEEIYDLVKNKNIEIIDVMKREELAVLNAISTVEGAISIAIENTDKNIHGSNVLILGFGRIGKVLAKKFTGLSANVTCAARKNEDFAWIEAYGCKGTNINKLRTKFISDMILL